MTVTPSLADAPADKVPFLLTALLAAAGWAVTHVVDRLQATPTVEYQENTETVTTKAGERVNRLAVRLHNLSSNVSYRNLTFTARQAQENTDVIFFEDGEMINNTIAIAPTWPSIKKALTSSTGASVVFFVETLPPNGKVDLVAHYRGSDKVLVAGRLTESEGPPLRLEKPSVATFLLRNEALVFISLLSWGAIGAFAFGLKKRRLRWILAAALLVVGVATPFVSFAQNSPDVMVTLIRVQNPNSQGVESEILLVDRHNREANFHFTDRNGIARPNKKCSKFDRLIARSIDQIWQSVESKAYCDKELLLRVAYSPLAALSEDSRNWVDQGGNSFNHRYSALAQIRKDNVSKLQVAWTFSTGVLSGHEGGPIVIGNTLYLHTPFPNKVFAIDLRSQTVRWKYVSEQDPKAASTSSSDSPSGGLAYAEGKVFLQQTDGKLVALDARNGDVVWSVMNGDLNTRAVSINAPRVFKDKIITGISGGGGGGVRGFIAAYHVSDGRLAWKGYSNGPDAEILVDPEKTVTWTDGVLRPVGRNSSLTTWTSEHWKTYGGDTPGVYSYDPALNLLYYGSGGPGSSSAAEPPSDKKWSTSIWARDIDTGLAKWVYQLTPNDVWGYGATNEPMLANINVNGRNRKVLVHFNDGGFAYTLDRETGELLSAEKYASTVNWASDVDHRSGRPDRVKSYHTSQLDVRGSLKGVCPAVSGGRGRQSAAFNPATGKFYVPMSNMCMDYEPFRAEYTAGRPYIGPSLTHYPAPGRESGAGGLLIWDAGLGRTVATKAERFPIMGGALVTSGGVACYGTLEGYLKCVDSTDPSKELFKFKTPSGIIGNVNTWESGGKQYIGVLSGIGGWAGIGMAAGLEKDFPGLGAVGGYRELNQYTDLGGSLIVFALPNQ